MSARLGQLSPKGTATNTEGNSYITWRKKVINGLAKKKGKAISVTARGGLQACEMSTLPHWLDNRLTDGGKVVSPTHRPRSTPQKHSFSASGTHFC
jgi:hypothetical protein